MSKARVLITGISGFTAKHCAVELLNAGYRVRGTVRNLASCDAVHATLGQHADVGALELVEADLLADQHWPGAVDGCNAVMHVALPILGGHVLMGTDALESMGQRLTAGNNVHINLEPDSRQEADRLFQALSAGGNVSMPMADMFWGDYFGSLSDKFGVHWMINCTEKKK